MIAAPLDLVFDIEKLQDHLEKYVIPLEPMKQSDAFGGWSVLSSNGSYQDGWHQGHLLMQVHTNNTAIQQGLTKMGAKRSSEYVIPTEICHGYLNEVVNEITKTGLRPRRARVIRLSAGSASSWHRDSPDHSRMVRLHVPIFTNAGCFFEVEGEREQLPATGRAYLLRVNRLHRVVNEGAEHRYHLVMDVTDNEYAIHAP